MVLRPWFVAVVTASLAGAGCHHTRPTVKTAGAKGVPRVAMDSAEIERVCAHPDSVRAGLADCVLRDQSPPGQPRLPSAPP